MVVYKRHLIDCQHANGAKKDTDHSHRCACSVYVEWCVSGKQHRRAVRDASGQLVSSWSEADKLVADNRQEGNPSVPAAAPVTLDEAVQKFLASKEGEGLAAPSLAKYKLTLSRLTDHFIGKGITQLSAVTAAAVLDMLDGGTLRAASAKLNNQSRLAAFFKFCASRKLCDNPMKEDEESFRRESRALGKQAKKDRQETVSPLDIETEYEALLGAVDQVRSMTAEATMRVKALMRLQRESGLSLIDAACLEKDELIHNGGVWRIKTHRQKSAEPVNNVIPAWLAEELLTVKNGNPLYFFWTGTSTPKSAVSYFDKLYRKAFKQAKIPTNGQLSHRFRHTFAVELLKDGVEMRYVSKALGHASIQTTERYYAKWESGQQATLDAALAKTQKKPIGTPTDVRTNGVQTLQRYSAHHGCDNDESVQRIQSIGRKKKTMNSETPKQEQRENLMEITQTAASAMKGRQV
jgi:integrase/recombinase XerD